MQLADIALRSLMAPHLAAAWAILGAAALGFVPFPQTVPQAEEFMSPPQQGHTQSSYLNICHVLLSGLWRQQCYAEFSSFLKWNQLYCINLMWKWESSLTDSILVACIKYMTIARTFRIVQYLIGIYRLGVCLPAAWLYYFTSVKSGVRGMCCPLETLQELCPAFQKQPPQLRCWLQWITIPEQGEVPRSEKLQN